MTRRSATLAVAGALIVALVAVASMLNLPYVVYSPGPVEDTLGEWNGQQVIQIEGAETYPTEGVLDLTTVGVTSADADLDLLTALRAWIDPDRAVIPRELVYPEGTTAEQSRQQNAAMLASSQQNAEVAALRKLGYDVPQRVVVDAVVADAPADGVLEPGDVVISVDGSLVDAPEDVVEAVTAHEPGESVTFVVDREGQQLSEDITTIAAEDDGRALVGFSPVLGFDLPVDIAIGIDERIGGPSAGMIFAVAIYDTLTPGALLDGVHVAGTGEISPDGDVGPIGGIQQKIAAANHDGAALFLAPASNCDEAVGGNNGDMQVVPIETLDDAVSTIEAFVAGDTDELPACPA
ncbi:YlbL family protein [Jiangella anatolica]|uniref:PDZ/DHR/GLGF domain-containing protein n=1 Tax=Jiangella anatolica TaxID=2670374 RepID=A0A2W2B6X5_9ACTN|nr:PDZ domain-containing protein [Jiangella anatolica]PZF80800.1 PDZ/DHR/GLGF domain-containing protein [Jiangella anatolica]